MTLDGLLSQYPNAERKTPPPTRITVTTATQVMMVSWQPPAQSYGVLEKLVISNQNAGAGTVALHDADITSTGTAGVTKPPVRGSAANPIVPTINIAANSQLYLGFDNCPNVKIIGGLVATLSVQPMEIYAQWIEVVG